MAVLRDLHYARPQSTYVGLPLVDIDTLGALKQGQYDQGQLQADQLMLKLRELDVRDVNQPILDQTAARVNSVIGELSKKGDWENSGPQLRALAMEIANDRPLQGALEDKALYDRQNEDWRKRLEKGEISADRYNAFVERANVLNNQQVQYDPTTSRYSNIWSSTDPMKSVDIGKELGEFMKTVKSSKSPIAFGKDAQGNPVYMRHENNQYFVNGHTEALTEAEAANLATGFIMNDPNISAYLKEGNELDRFGKFYDRDTRSYRQPTIQDVMTIEPGLVEQAASAGVDLNTLTPQQVDDLYKAATLSKSATDIAKPYAGAASFSNTTLDFKQDNDHLARLRADLGLRNELAGIRARAASEKDLYDYKKKADKAEEERGLIVGSNPIAAETFYEPISSGKTTDAMKTRLSEIQAMRATGIGVNENLLNEERQLKDQVRVREQSNADFMSQAIQGDGRKYIDEAWNEYVRNNPSPELTRAQFEQRIISGNIQEPNRVKAQNQTVFGIELGGVSMGGGRLDPRDVNTYLKDAEFRIKKDDKLVKKYNDEVPAGRESNSLTGAYTGTLLGDNSEKDYINAKVPNYVDAVSQLATHQIINNQGIGFTVMGTGKPLNEALKALNINAGEEDKGKYIFKAEPQDRPLPVSDSSGRMNHDAMYNLNVIDAKTGNVVFHGRVRPNDQGSHQDLILQMNDQIIRLNEGTEVARRAEASNALIQYPQFDLFNQDILLNDVKPTDPVGTRAYGSVVQVPGKGKFAYVASNKLLPTGERSDNPLIVKPAEKQKVVQLVRLADDTPAGLTLNSDNINRYLFVPNAGIDGNAALTEDDATTVEDTYFKSTLDALTRFSKK